MYLAVVLDWFSRRVSKNVSQSYSLFCGKGNFALNVIVYRLDGWGIAVLN